MNFNILFDNQAKLYKFISKVLVVGCSVGNLLSVVGQTGGIHEPVRYIGGTHINRFTHEGGLRYAIGVENIQTMRANRSYPEHSDGFGWTYNHASNLAFWNGQFFQQYISGESDEHVPPVQTLLITSKDGKEWSFPKVVFPPYQAPEGVKIPEGSTGYMMHQRMGFYVAPNGRFLTLAFYGHTENPFRENGIGRVVREIYKDGTFGPIYFIRYDSQTNWDESNTSYPFYKTSKDKGFIKACEALLKDKKQTLQWFEEDNGDDGFYTFNKGEQAFSWYHRNDGKVVGLWKKSYTALSDDEGETFSDPVKAQTLIMSGGKMWGQQTEDGKYAISYNPIDQTQYRFPMALVTSTDGIVYDNLLLVQGEVPPRRFFGRWKDFGPCYMRGITEGNGNPPGDDMWMTYSMNKEDIWMCRIPVPIKYAVTEDVNDDFENMREGGNIINWNTYSPKWAKVNLIKEPNGNRCLQLTDEDHYDYSRAIRVFEEGTNVKAHFKIKLESIDTTQFDIDITDRYGNRPVQITVNKEGMLFASNGSVMKSVMKLRLDEWYEIKIEMNTSGLGSYSLFLNEEQVIKEAPTVMAVKSVERLSFRTGAYRDIPNRETPNEEKYPPLLNADEKQNKSSYLIDNVFVSTKTQ